MSTVKSRYNSAKEKYNELGINTDEALDKLESIAFSLKCCNIVDIENRNDTSDYKGEEGYSPKLRDSLEKAFSMIPGKHRISLNAVHMDTDEFVELDEIETVHYALWTAWAKKHTAGMDFYTSMVRHEKSDKGFALSDRNKDIRYFWVEHCQRCRIVGQYIGKELDNVCITTIHINDFFETIPTDGVYTREMLVDSLNKIYAEKVNRHYTMDSLSSGLGRKYSQYLAVADNRFCQNYAIKNELTVNINSREIEDEKDIYHSFNAVVPFAKKVVVNICPEKNSDNVIVLNDKIKDIARYIVHNNLLDKVMLCLDFKTEMDDLAKVKKWVIGTRSVQKAFLLALLEPGDILKKCDDSKDFNSKTALAEEFKSYPYGAVWDYFCHAMNVPVGLGWLKSGNHLDE